MKKLFFLLSLSFLNTVLAQNIGIGTLNPLAKLHVYNGNSGASPFVFSQLVVENNGHSYINILSPSANEGAILFGQPGNAAHGVLMYNNASTPNGFQFRTNGNITRMMIDNAGNIGIGLLSAEARLSISANGTELTGTASGNMLRTNAGVLGNAVGNELSLANIGFLSGNNSSLGIRAYRRTAGSDWTSTALLLGYDVDNVIRAAGGGSGFLALSANGNIGIGTANPLAPLGFPPSLGKKITLYPGATGDAGFGMAGNRLQIYSDNPNADVAFGYDASGTFNEVLAIKPTGALALNTDAGNTGQLLQSNGSSAPVSWINPEKSFVSITNFPAGTMVNDGDETNVAAVTVVVKQSSYVEVSGSVGLNAPGCFNCGNANVYLLVNDPPLGQRVVATNPNVILYTSMNFTFTSSFPLAAGTYVYTLKAKKMNGPTVSVVNGAIGTVGTQYSSLAARVIPY